MKRLGSGLERALDLGAGPVDMPGRQRTLWATIEWSYGLLSEAQRMLLARLSVFSGAWTLAASEAVGIVEGDLDAVDTLAALVAQSLVRVDEPGPDEPRFRMLQTVRAYAAERLTERGETGAIAGDGQHPGRYPAAGLYAARAGRGRSGAQQRRGQPATG